MRALPLSFVLLASPASAAEPIIGRAEIVDGDTLAIAGQKEGIRLYGVAAPEPKRTCDDAVGKRYVCDSRSAEYLAQLVGRTLFTDAGETLLQPGMVAGFVANGTVHHLENRTDRDRVIPEVGDRSAGDRVSYPADVIDAIRDTGGGWRFARKDGMPY